MKWITIGLGTALAVIVTAVVWLRVVVMRSPKIVLGEKSVTIVLGVELRDVSIEFNGAYTVSADVLAAGQNTIEIGRATSLRGDALESTRQLDTIRVIGRHKRRVYEMTMLPGQAGLRPILVTHIGKK